MGLLSRMRSAVTGVLCVTVLLCFSFPAGASPGGYAVQPEIAQLLLTMAGVETELIALSREDDFNRAIHIAGVRGNDILIGFPDAGIRKEVPFLLALNGEELIVELAEQGELEVLSGNPEVIPAGITDFIGCLVNSIGDLIGNILECGISPLCLVGVVFNGVFRILGCIFSIL